MAVVGGVTIFFLGVARLAWYHPLLTFFLVPCVLAVGVGGVGGEDHHRKGNEDQ